MRKILIAIAALFIASSAFAGPVRYEPGTSYAAIAQDQRARAAMDPRGVGWCNLIDTRTGRCMTDLSMHAGGGDGGAGASAGASGGGSSGGSSGGGGCK